MRILHLTLLFSALNVLFFSAELEKMTTSRKEIPSLVTANPISGSEFVPGATNIFYQSKDGGLTWQDISTGLPENAQPQDFFAGESEVYLRMKDILYRSKTNLRSLLAWEEQNALDPKNAVIAFNHSGVLAFNYDGQIYQRISSADAWSRIYTNFEKRFVRTIFETTDGVIFIGCDSGLYKSSDKGQTWKQVQNEGVGMDIAESEGVLIAAGGKGIMRSADKGEHWEWVVSEGGVGIAVESVQGGFVAIAYNTTIKARQIHLSLDYGKTWKVIGESLRPSSSVSSIKRQGGYLICGHPDGIFRSADMGQTWQLVHPGVGGFNFGYENNRTGSEKVFKIYSSGGVLYAVARDAGC